MINNKIMKKAVESALQDEKFINEAEIYNNYKEKEDECLKATFKGWGLISLLGLGTLTAGIVDNCATNAIVAGLVTSVSSNISLIPAFKVYEHFGKEKEISQNNLENIIRDKYILNEFKENISKERLANFSYKNSVLNKDSKKYEDKVNEYNKDLINYAEENGQVVNYADFIDYKFLVENKIKDNNNLCENLKFDYSEKIEDYYFDKSSNENEI